MDEGKIYMTGSLTKIGSYWYVIYNGNNIPINNPIRQFMLEGKNVEFDMDEWRKEKKFEDGYWVAYLIIPDKEMVEKSKNEILINGNWYSKLNEELKNGDSFIYFPYPEDEGIMIAELTTSQDGKLCVFIPDEHHIWKNTYGLVDITSSSIWKIKLIEE